MIISFVLFLLLSERYELFSQSKPVFLLHQTSVQTDGTIILVTDTEVYHFDDKGKLLRSIGGKGDGPGEFRSIWASVWTGERYLIHDVGRNDVSLFDHDGQYLGRNQFMVENLMQRGTSLFAVRLTPFLQGKRDVKPLVRIGIDTNNQVVFKGKPFHFARPEIFEFNINFKEFFVTVDQDHIYVVDQFRPEVTIYNHDLEKTGFLKMALREYQPPKTSWSRDLPRKQSLRKMYATSWIRMLEKVSGGFVVSFWTPDPNDPDASRILTQAVKPDGKNARLGVEIKGLVVGVHGQELYSIEEDDEDVRYFLRKDPIALE